MSSYCFPKSSQIKGDKSSDNWIKASANFVHTSQRISCRVSLPSFQRKHISGVKMDASQFALRLYYLDFKKKQHPQIQVLQSLGNQICTPKDSWEKKDNRGWERAEVWGRLPTEQKPGRSCIGPFAQRNVSDRPRDDQRVLSASLPYQSMGICILWRASVLLEEQTP